MDEKSKQKEKDQSTSKLQRILCSHSLQGLVYEKRERKQFINAFAQPTNNKNIKYKHHRLIKTKNKKEAIQQKKKLKVKEKHIQKMKKNQRKQMEKNQQLDIQGKDKQQPRKRGRPKKVQNSLTLRKNQQQLNEKNKNQEVQQKQMQEVQSENLQASQIQSQQSQQIKEEQQFNRKPSNKKSYIRNKEAFKQNAVSKSQNNEKNKKRGRPKSKLKITRFQKKNKDKIVINNKVGQLEKNKNIESEQSQKQLQKNNRKMQKNQKSQIISHALNSENNKLEKSARKQQQQQHQNIQLIQQQDNQDDQEVKRKQKNENNQKNTRGRRLLRLKRKVKSIKQANKSLEEDNDEQQQEQQNEDKAQLGKTRKLRQRKTKEQAIRKLMYEGYSDNQDIEYYQTRRKKGGGGGVVEKEYQINRIFRKTQKLNLPNIKLDVDIMNCCLEQFGQKFNSFDMIHCSLPLDMMIKMPTISCLISKGFIFIWVEKGQIQIGYHWLNRIGFDVIDQIMWIKTNQDINQVKYDENTDDEIFPNSRSTCLVGYKCSASQRTEYCTKISNNIIFSPERPGSIEKPDQIYQIGDLMMPGAKKLQIGFKQVGGWFTLKHKQSSFARCHQCFRKDHRNLFMISNKQIKCEFCLIHNLRKKKQSKQSLQQRNIQFRNDAQLYSELLILSNIYKLEIVNKRFAQSLGCVCKSCQKGAPQLMQAILKQQKSVAAEQIKNAQSQHINNQIKKQQNTYCKQCLILPAKTSYIKVHNLKQIYFSKKYIKCSKCNKHELQKYYFQCFTCKTSHILCSQCLLSIPSQQEAGNKNHQWKLRILNDFPQTRTVCFICAQQCMIPYWGCETCQNWYWCGRCDKNEKPKMHQHHCHYTRDHNLHLIM